MTTSVSKEFKTFCTNVDARTVIANIATLVSACFWLLFIYFVFKFSSSSIASDRQAVRTPNIFFTPLTIYMIKIQKGANDNIGTVENEIKVKYMEYSAANQEPSGTITFISFSPVPTATS